MLTFAEAARRPVAEVGAEPHQLAARGAPGLLIPAAFEEAYYRGVNLPEQLGRLFAEINPRRIDEDRLEKLCVQAQALVRTSVLLDDATQGLYRALGNAGLATPRGDALALRRPDTAWTERAQRVTPPGTAALHALKRLWAHDWTLEAVTRRLEEGGSVGLEARPVLVLPG